MLAIKIYTMSDGIQRLWLIIVSVGEAIFSLSVEVNSKNGVSLEE